MRFLNTEWHKLEEFSGEIPSHAILSHRWGDGEVTFKDVSYNRSITKGGWPKVIQSCLIANANDISHIWIDLCCIDKSSSAELTEFIHSMYAWYEQAAECYAFLHDVDALPQASDSQEVYDKIESSVWFTRGWTLQELIAPTKVTFFNRLWQPLWTKSSHSHKLDTIVETNAESMRPNH